MSDKREKNKGERRKKILRAAFDLFTEKGFEETTTREIATKAGVAVGTVFLYAQDKVDLLLISINDELAQLTDEALDKIDERQPLIDQVTDFFWLRYLAWSRYPKLSRAAAREMATIFPPEGPSEELTRGLARRAYTVDKLRTLLQRSAEKGELKPDTDIDAAAWIIYDIFLTELRYWLAAEKPDPRAGLARYRHLLEIILSGLINTSGRKRKR